MTLSKQAVCNLLGVSRAWVNKRIASKPARRQPTHEEVVAMVNEWKEQAPDGQERERWKVLAWSVISFMWRTGYFVTITKSHGSHIFAKGGGYPTKAIAGSFLGGWTIDQLAIHYPCDRLDIEAAIAFELKARGT